RRKKETQYGKQLREKQLARYMFGVSEKQFRMYYKKAARQDGITGNNLVRLLERRLDNVIYRAGFAATRPAARQAATHGHFILNGRRVDVPSIMVRPGDEIVIREKLQKTPIYEELSAVQGNWLEVDAKKKSIKVLNIPEDDQLEKAVNSQIIVEYYSR
ncbi:MAG: 30S ribosomal protein S4, partial [Patescibacteria group bacterium]|nr:30S ribosomal protein S4 [Patescibacteria group bacterium]